MFPIIIHDINVVHVIILQSHDPDLQTHSGEAWPAWLSLSFDIIMLLLVWFKPKQEEKRQNDAVDDFVCTYVYVG